MFSKIIKYAGNILIISFSVISIFFSLAEREIDDPRTKKLMSYTSFFEDRFYDMRMRQTLSEDKQDKRLVMADIDDYSLKEIGQWPIQRETWTTMINKLKGFGAKVIAFDVFFAEDSKVCNNYSPDDDMAKSITNFQSIPGNKVILPYSLDTLGADHFKELPDTLYNFIMDTKQSEGLNLKTSRVSKAVYPINKLVNVDPSLGHIQVEADSDGIMRHYRLVGNIDSLYLPSYSLAAYQHYTGDGGVLEMLNIGDNKLNMRKGNLSLNHKGEAKVRWLGDETHFPKVSLYDIISANDNDPKMIEKFSNTIVFVGASAYGAYDLRHTPVNPMLPGVYFHMNMTHMLLEGKFFQAQADSTLYSWLILIIGTSLILIIQAFGHAIVDLFATIILVSSAYLIDTFYLLPLGYEIKLFFCLFSILACYSWNTFLHFYLANKDKAFLKHAFGSYISPALIDEMYESGKAPKLGGDCGVRTAFFTDIQGFSTFSEKLSATQLVELLNEYLTAMTDILLGEGGTLDKYEGDAIIAFFGAPMPLEDHADRAFRVACKMQESLVELREKWISEGDKWPQIVKDMRMRIGINSGEIVTGNMGSRDRMNYTMMGDSVNLAARLEEAAKQYGIFTKVSEYSLDLITHREEFTVRELDTIRVVGKTEPVKVYEVMGRKEHIEPWEVEIRDKFHEGLTLYKNQQWTEALAIFNSLIDEEFKRAPELKHKTNPSKVYAGRCEEFLENPPGENWDGVYTLTEK
jgi:adenylate cyclase